MTTSITITGRPPVIPTVADPSVLTAHDLAALRHCNSVAFHHTSGWAWMQPEVGPATQRPDLDRATRAVYDQPAYGDRSMRVIGVDSEVHALTFQPPDAGPYRVGRHDWTREPAVQCRLTLYSPANEPEWWTLAAALRVGDRVTLRWRGNINDTADRAGLCMDELTLMVERKPWHGLGVRRFALPVFTSVYTADDPDRMVVRHP